MCGNVGNNTCSTLKSVRAERHSTAFAARWEFCGNSLSFVIFCVAGYAGAREAVKRLVFENPDYHVQTIELQTDGTLQREQVLKAAGLHEGANIFSVNLASVRDRIQQLPQADEVEVVRKLPGEIDIRVVERKPVAWITSETEINDPFTSDAAFLVGARGVLMKQKKLLPEYLGLPLIVGCSSETLEAGKIVESPEVKTALELLRLTESTFLQMRFQIREIDVSKSYCLLVTDKNRSRVMFGLNDLEGQLRRLQVFLDYCDNTKQELETVNLVAQRNIPGDVHQSGRGCNQRHSRAGCRAADYESNPGARAGKPRSPGLRQTRNWSRSAKIARCFCASFQDNS